MISINNGKNISKAKPLTMKDINKEELIKAIHAAFDNQVHKISNRIVKSVRKELKKK